MQEISNIEVVSFCQETADHDCTCAVCLCDFEDGEQLKRLPCGHHFHEVLGWMGWIIGWSV